MRIGAIGRTGMLLRSILACLADGHDLGFVITAKAAPEYEVKEDAFEALAAEHDAPFFFGGGLNSAPANDFLDRCPECDVVISVNFVSVIGNAVISRFRHGILNAHAGDLPRYRGNAPVAWAMVQGESRIGHCIHRMVGGNLDCGDILVKRFFAIGENTRIAEAFEWLEAETPSMFAEALRILGKDPEFVLERQPETGEKTLRCYPRMPEDGRIDWTLPAIDLVRLINASSEPFAGAFASLGDKTLRIWNAFRPLDAASDERYLAIPGQVAAINRKQGTVDVITGNGKLRITEVAYDGIRGRPTDFIGSIRTRLH